MIPFKVITALIFLGSVFEIQGIEHDWAFEFLSIDIQNSSPEIADINVTVYRKDRSNSVLAIWVDVKQNLNDELFIEGIAERSASGTEDYTLLPFKLTRASLSPFMNSFYKLHLMPFLKECTTNSPVFEVFIPPLKPTQIEGKECALGIDKMPGHLDPGYYKITIKLTGQMNAVIVCNSRVDNDPDK